MFNPVEASTLAHYPVHSLTYAAAKITHVLVAVLYLVCGDRIPGILRSFGAFRLGVCSVIHFTDFHHASWICLTAPAANLRAFARGIYWALWIPWAAWPHFALLPFLLYLWGWKEASL